MNNLQSPLRPMGDLSRNPSLMLAILQAVQHREAHTAINKKQIGVSYFLHISKLHRLIVNSYQCFFNLFPFNILRIGGT
jgi:hypothetical protein